MALFLARENLVRKSLIPSLILGTLLFIFCALASASETTSNDPCEGSVPKKNAPDGHGFLFSDFTRQLLRDSWDGVPATQENPVILCLQRSLLEIIPHGSSPRQFLNFVATVARNEESLTEKTVERSLREPTKVIVHQETDGKNIAVHYKFRVDMFDGISINFPLSLFTLRYIFDLQVDDGKITGLSVFLVE